MSETSDKLSQLKEYIIIADKQAKGWKWATYILGAMLGLQTILPYIFPSEISNSQSVVSSSEISQSISGE